MNQSMPNSSSINNNRLLSEDQQPPQQQRPTSITSKSSNSTSKYKPYGNSQTMYRKHKSNQSTSRSKRLRNRSLEMVLDDTGSADSSTGGGSNKSDYHSRSGQGGGSAAANARLYSRSLERPKPRRSDRYWHTYIYEDFLYLSMFHTNWKKIYQGIL